MVAKKKTVKSSVKAEASPLVTPEESNAHKERKPSITQVVEVVEDAAPLEDSESSKSENVYTPLEEPSSGVEINKEPFEKGESSLSQEPIIEDKAADEKRKELVDELFQKKPSRPLEVAPEISVHSKRTTKPILLWAIGMVVMCIVVGVGLLVLSGKTGSFPSIVIIPTPTPTTTPEITPTPTPEETKRDLLTIQVLNGGGVAGAATKMKKSLEDKGYKVVDTGNASSYTYDKTEILVKSAKKAYIALLEEDLKELYTLGSSAATLEDGVSYDARVTVGKE